MAAPTIENLWNMDNTLTLINTAKYQIKILCTIKIWTETADFFYNRCLCEEDLDYNLT